MNDPDLDERALAYQSLSSSFCSVPSSARGRLMVLGSGIVQRRVRMATEPASSLLGVGGVGGMMAPVDSGLKSLGRSRTGTSPLVDLDAGQFLSKSGSFHNIPTRFIDETRIEEHRRIMINSEPVAQPKGRKYQTLARGLTVLYWTIIFAGLLGIAFSGSVLFGAGQNAHYTTWHRDFGKEPKFRTAAVASEHELCSQIGVGMLKRGGNAVDAALASLICVGALNNFSSGIGGGGFMLIRVNVSYATVIDYRETAPSGIKLSDFDGHPERLISGGLSVAVPSQIKGISMAHRRFGKIPWPELFEPSILLCQQGFPVTSKLTKVISKWAGQIEASPAMRETYMKCEDFHDSQKQQAEDDGCTKWIPKSELDVITRPNLAKTLQLIASEGPDAFWTETITGPVVTENQRSGGKLTIEDIKEYEPVERDPVYGEFAGYKVTTIGAPAGGVPLLQILKILEGLHLRNETSPTEKHLFVEALKFGYASRMKVADPAFHPEVHQQEEAMLRSETIARILSKIDPNQTHQPDYYLEAGQAVDEPHDHGTTHICVLDKDGMAVSLTDTVNLEFGSFIMDQQTGILQNNEMGDFSLPGYQNSYGLPPSPVNYPMAGKRPVSSSTPIILEKDGKVVLVTGAAGGSRIISVTAQIIMDLIIYKLNPITAMMDPRIHHQLLPNEVIVDYGTSAELVSGLINHGHRVTVLPRDTALTSVQFIVCRKNGDIWALSDPRKGGLAAGYSQSKRYPAYN